jgi:hypothetical protein
MEKRGIVQWLLEALSVDQSSTPADKFVYTSSRQRLACIGPLERLRHPLTLVWRNGAFYGKGQRGQKPPRAATPPVALCRNQDFCNKTRALKELSFFVA